MQKWEYKTLARSRSITAKGGFRYAGDWDPKDLDSTLKSLGDEGWELVAISPRSDFGADTDVRGGPIIAGMTTTEIWVFKRPLK